ncbi:MAG: glycoside hydrolase family 3 protein [Defluviitaleaceae bacterium]|nr:glycoside hydrolase family 3 protein [Defluviitaleaceae bacterium]
MNLNAKPFNLSSSDITWVNNTLSNMTEDEKIGQLFCMIAYHSDEEYIKNLAQNIKPGGLMCRPMPLKETVETVNLLQKSSKVPMLIAANLESGGNGAVTEATKIGSPLQVAATDDIKMADKLGAACGEVGAAAGINWTFAPIVDLDLNFRNPITNTRTFGSDTNRVRDMGVAYVEAVQGKGVAATAKHFPGDGVDERDHHLVTSVNDLPHDEWDKTFGEVYRASIDAGVMSVMIGHISLPDYEKKMNPGIKDADIMPASLSKQVVTGLLREQLGFNGLIVTDATTMAGMTISMPRAKAVPWTIACGCDMFLFTKNMDEDIAFMHEGVKSGILTTERLDEAVTRILAMKAALGLHKNSLQKDIKTAAAVVNSTLHKNLAKECADKAITLVKEEAGVLPITPDKYKRVLFYGIEAKQGFAYSVKVGVAADFKQRLINEGFDVDEFDQDEQLEGWLRPVSEIVGKYDLIVYLANMATKSNQTVVRIEWELPMGKNVPIYMESVPTIFISVENPYHLLDVPRVKTFINTYSSTDEVLTSLIEKLTGKAPFTGKSPVDAFCGRWDARL